MEGQGSLFGEPPKRHGPGDPVFLLVRVEPTAGIEATAADLKARYGLTGALRRDTLHMSLVGLGVMEDIAPTRLAAARQPGLAADIAPFPIRFDTAMSLPAKGDSALHPLALICDQDAGRLRALTGALHRALRARGVRLPARSPSLFHVTLLYDRLIVPERAPLLQPITLEVQSVRLVRSLHGKACHEELANHPLAH